ncbi:hypothetical protein L2E82_35695 [Cichorium intybus]|uniref:Uncharacterized protein n=1 Tax=Cichorium intybus TaxID=13427 RepID=A0ACB9BPK3_CICIN|nr:hypothetical protein L2E82_35695 [Cichorium intybus]
MLEMKEAPLDSLVKHVIVEGLQEPQEGERCLQKVLKNDENDETSEDDDDNDDDQADDKSEEKEVEKEEEE